MKFMLVLCAFGLMAMLTVWQHAQSVRAGYEIVKLRKQRNVLAEENRRLELEADRLKSPENLLMRVKELGLGLRPAKPEEIIRIGSGTASGTRIEPGQPLE
jgi:cell division protein FtsL